MSERTVKEAQSLVASGAWREARARVEAAIAAGEGAHDGEAHAELLNVLATASIKGGELDRAELELGQAAARAPASYKPWANLAIVHKTRGDLAQCSAALAQAVERAPRIGRLWARLGQAELEQSRFAEAAEALERAFALEPTGPVQAQLARASLACGRHARAAELLADARGAEELALRVSALAGGGPALWPALEPALGALVVAKADADALTQAIDALGATSALAPLALRLGQERAVAALDEAGRSRVGEALMLAAGQLMKEGRLDLADPLVARALALAPENARVADFAGEHAFMACDLPRAVALHDRASRLGSRSEALLFALLHDERASPEAVAYAHRALALRLHTPARVAARAPAAPRDGRRLTLGFLSGDFRDHAVFRFAEGLLRELDRARFQVVAYFTAPRHADETTRRFAASDVTFVEVQGSDAEVAARIAADGVDILVDLAGRTYGHRAGALVRRPAPLILTYLGWPATTGMGEVDLRVSDARVDPPGLTEALHSEALLRLPHAAWNFCGTADVPIRPRPAGRIALASFQRGPKISDANLRAWARILAEVPRAELLLKGRGLDSELARRRLTRALEAQGVDVARVHTRAWTAHVDDHLALWNGVDIALDTWPYAGTTTTCETLWMGVPVVSLTGDAHVSRVGASLLAEVGLEELVARDWEEYVAKVVALARDDARLAALRATLRERLAASLLGDSKRFAQSFGDALLAAWQAFEREDVAVVDASSRRVGERAQAVYVPPDLADPGAFVAVASQRDARPDLDVLAAFARGRTLHVEARAAFTAPLLDLLERCAAPAGAVRFGAPEPVAGARFAASARRRGLALTEGPARAGDLRVIAADDALAIPEGDDADRVVLSQGRMPDGLHDALVARGWAVLRPSPGAGALIPLAPGERVGPGQRALVLLRPPRVGALALSRAAIDRARAAIGAPSDDAATLARRAQLEADPLQRAALLELALARAPDASTRARLGWELGAAAVVHDALAPLARAEGAAPPEGALAPLPRYDDPSAAGREVGWIEALLYASPTTPDDLAGCAALARRFVRGGGESLAVDARIGACEALLAASAG